MIDILELKSHLGQLIELRFIDGHRVRAKLISVDGDEEPEVMYRIEEVLAVGPPALARAKPGAVVTADPREIAGYSKE